MNRSRLNFSLLSALLCFSFAVGSHAREKRSTPMPISTAEPAGYLQIFAGSTAIQGSSTAAGYQGWIDVISFVNNPPASNSAASGGAAKRVTTGTIVITKKVDRASAILAKDSSAGTHLTKAVLVAINRGKAAEKWTFTDVTITSIESSSGRNGPEEKVTLSYLRSQTQSMN
jgi:type VI secretion system Hcp family effector